MVAIKTWSWIVDIIIDWYGTQIEKYPGMIWVCPAMQADTGY